MSTPGTLGPRQEPDVVIIGAGTFGAVLAWALGRGGRRTRTLVLESGALARTEHVQNAPPAEETIPPPRTLGPETDVAPADGGRWRVPWRSPLPYHGLAYGVGGRSLFWGAYCVWPLLDQDGIRERWPAGVPADLRTRYLPAAAELLGLHRYVPYFDGALNRLLRTRLAGALAAGRLPAAWPARALPGNPAAGPDVADQASRLHLPLAIDVVDDGGSPRLVRFSSAPLLTERMRDGSGDLELITGCHVVGLRAENGRIVAIETSRGPLRVPAHTRVVLAAGTVENARLVLGATGLPPVRPAVHRLTTHLRSNLTVRVPFPFDAARSGTPRPPAGACGSAALHVRGSCRPRPGATTRFHHQITAYGIGRLPDEAARRLFTETPRYDVEALDRALRAMPARHLVITVASVAEMTADGAGEVSLLPERDEFGARRAYVRLDPGPADLRAWEVMDRSADAVVRALAGAGPCEVLRPDGFAPAGGGLPGPEERREPLGCGHHEMGTLPMGGDPGSSHTDADGRVHGTHDLYVAGPAVFPALDSAGPVLPGIALTLRLADHLHDRREAPVRVRDDSMTEPGRRRAPHADTAGATSDPGAGTPGE